MRDKKLKDLIRKYEGDGGWISGNERQLNLMSAMCIKKSQPHIWYGLVQGAKSPLILIAAILLAGAYPLMILEFILFLENFPFTVLFSLIGMVICVNLILVFGIGLSLGLPFNLKWLLGAVVGMVPIELIPKAKKINWQFLHEIECEIFIDSKFHHIILFYACLTGKTYRDSEKETYAAILSDFENTVDSIGSHLGVPVYFYMYSIIALICAGALLQAVFGVDIFLILYESPLLFFSISILFSWTAFSHIMLMTSMCHWIHGRPALSDCHPINQVGFMRMVVLFALVVCVNHLGYLVYDSLFGVPDFFARGG